MQHTLPFSPETYSRAGSRRLEFYIWAKYRNWCLVRGSSLDIKWRKMILYGRNSQGVPYLFVCVWLCLHKLLGGQTEKQDLPEDGLAWCSGRWVVRHGDTVRRGPFGRNQNSAAAASSCKRKLAERREIHGNMADSLCNCTGGGRFSPLEGQSDGRIPVGWVYGNAICHVSWISGVWLVAIPLFIWPQFICLTKPECLRLSGTYAMPPVCNSALVCSSLPRPEFDFWRATHALTHPPTLSRGYSTTTIVSMHQAMANSLLKGRRAWVGEIKRSKWHAICCVEVLLEGWLPVGTTLLIFWDPPAPLLQTQAPTCSRSHLVLCFLSRVGISGKEREFWVGSIAQWCSAPSSIERPLFICSRKNSLNFEVFLWMSPISTRPIN